MIEGLHLLTKCLQGAGMRCALLKGCGDTIQLAEKLLEEAGRNFPGYMRGNFLQAWIDLWLPLSDFGTGCHLDLFKSGGTLMKKNTPGQHKLPGWQTGAFDSAN